MLGKRVPARVALALSVYFQGSFTRRPLLGAGSPSRSAVSLLVFLALSLCGAVRAGLAQSSFPPDFDDEIYVSGLNLPTDAVFANDGRLFVTEKNGRVRVVTSSGQLLTAPFTTVVANTQNDRGLLGITLDPQFDLNGYVYIYYVTEFVPPNPPYTLSRIARVTRWTANGNVAIPGSETIIVDNIPSDADSHVGGALNFGPDGKLYVSIGDGSSYDVASSYALRAQNLDELNGKILRLNPDGSAPTDNPFYTTPSATRSKVWQYGLRNPFKAVFRPNSSRLYINDVGWSDWEETDAAPVGSNFGWPCYEGNGRQSLYFQIFPSQCNPVVPTAPNYTYAHVGGQGGAIVGGTFYTGSSYPSNYQGKFFFADYSQKWIKYAAYDSADRFQSLTNFATGGGNFRPVDMLMAPDGNLYYINLGTDLSAATGSIDRIGYVGSGNHPPKPIANANPTAGYAPLFVAFDGTGTTDADGDPLTYHWIFGDNGSADGFAVSHTYTQSGTFLVVLQVSDGKVQRESKLTIVVGSLPPSAKIAQPKDHATYEEGQTVFYSGSGSDPDDGPLPDNNLTWTVLQHHNEHIHPYHDSIGPSGSFNAEGGHGAPGDKIFYEIVLTVTDSTGLQDVKRRFIYLNEPPKANAGPDQSASCVLPDQWVYLDGTGSSDPNDQPLIYRWDQTAGTSVTIVDGDKALARFHPPRQAGGTNLFFQLTVDDGHVRNSDTTQVTVPDLTDSDNDGFPACGDCNPNRSQEAPPGQTGALKILADKRTIQWPPVLGVTGYDLSRGDFSSSGRFRYTHGCFQQGLLSPQAVDPALPPAGTGFYYLSRAYNSCGRGILGTSGDGAGVPNPVCP